ncbi:UNVERIFIED_CONTAM: hypothetical protein HDU68_007273 [Siphonaria sp. JEL0065]|nr:hypothetical protein HDU68_009848 [Siphonaria sp. JEL0065]KAJ3030912.1 hypothetical protein HDU68_007273 [Siphonaria sp. JEL0065]
MTTEYKIEVSPSARATCQGCKTNIAKDAIRFVSIGSTEKALFDKSYYKCIGCVTKKQIENVEAAVESIDNIPGLDLLSAEQRSETIAALTEAKNAPAPMPTPKKRKAKDDNQEQEAIPAKAEPKKTPKKAKKTVDEE